MFDLLTRCCDFIKQYEGYSSTPYLPTKKDKPTIGFGNTRYESGEAVTLDDPEIDEARAQQLLEHWVQKIMVHVTASVDVDLTDEQFIALVSFDYNTGHLQNSTLLKKLNDGDYDGAAREFDRWIYQKGKILKGLVTRRAQERELFES